jgi:hypothetical protein
MTVNDMGRFCGKCQKNVVDFTAFSDEDIIAYFTINKDKETCGRFYKKQLDRVIIPIDTYTFSFRMTARQRLLVLFLLFFGYDLYKVELVFAQNAPPDSTLTNPIDTQKSRLSSVNDTLIKTEVAADVVQKDTMNVDSLAVADVDLVHPKRVDKDCRIDMEYGDMVMMGYTNPNPQEKPKYPYPDYFANYGLDTPDDTVIAETNDDVSKSSKEPKKQEKMPQNVALLPEKLAFIKKEEE